MHDPMSIQLDPDVETDGPTDEKGTESGWMIGR